MFDTEFAHNVYKSKYAKEGEEWSDTASRVTSNVMGALPGKWEDESAEVERLINDRKLIPGGRYLYAAGNDLHQVQNCFSGDTRILTRTGTFSLEELSGQSVEVRNRFGEWEWAEIQCFGEQELLNVEFENGASVEATEGHLWWQKDGSRVSTADLESVPFSVPAEFPEEDPEGVRHGIVFGDGHLIRNKYSQIVFVNPEKDQSLVDWFDSEERTITLGFGAQIKVQTVRETKRGTVVSLQPKRYKSLPEKYSPEYARGFIAGLIATDGCVPETGSVQIHCEGLERAKKIAEIAVAAGCVVNSVRVTDKVSPYTGEPRELSCVSIKPFSAPVILPSHKERTDARNLRRNFRPEVGVESITETGRYEPVYCAVVPNSESFTLANGLITSNCLLLRAEDTREGWADLSWKCEMALLTGAGIGVYYGDIRPSGAPIKRTGGVASGPIPKMVAINELGRAAVQGGSRRSAIWAGLLWSHPDCEAFIRAKDWPEWLREQKEKDFNTPAPLDMTNISVCLDDEFFEAFEDESHEKHELAHRIYHKAVDKMVTTGEPGFSVDLGDKENEKLRNACTEVTSEDDSDICNLGGIVISRFDDPAEFGQAVRFAALFLTAGTLYSDLPYQKVGEVREKNRRLGLDIIGAHEFLLKRGLKYGTDESLQALEPFMQEYDRALEYAHQWQDNIGISRSVAATSGAPTGTRGIIAESTTGWEPVTAAAYKRRVRRSSPDGDKTSYEYVVDPTIKRLTDQGYISPGDTIEDAHSLSYDLERRLRMQAYAQSHTDQGISMTINLPYPISDEQEQQDFSDLLYKYLPKLRGITCYPNNARGGQPITPVPLEEALGQEGLVFEEDEEKCASGVCGI